MAENSERLKACGPSEFAMQNHFTFNEKMQEENHEYAIHFS